MTQIHVSLGVRVAIKLSASMEYVETKSTMNSVVYSPGFDVTVCHSPVLSVCKTLHVS